MNGEKIHGQYPSSLSSDGPDAFLPGIVVPKMPWDSLWNGLSQWFGITDSSDLDEVLPNRNKFPPNMLFNCTDLFV